MGHMLNNTLQDVLVRRARMSGKNACWVPGMDHASIATEAKVVAMLREKGIEKSSLTREEFLRHAWEWKEKYGGVILKQLRKLGASCDWDRTCFTMDEARTESVHARLLRPLRERQDLPRRKDGQLGPRGADGPLGRGGGLQGVARQALLPALQGRGNRPGDHRRHDAPRDHSGRYGAVRQPQRRALRVAARRRPRRRAAGGTRRSR